MTEVASISQCGRAGGAVLALRGMTGKGPCCVYSSRIPRAEPNATEGKVKL